MFMALSPSHDKRGSGGAFSRHWYDLQILATPWVGHAGLSDRALRAL
jgi:hypothetical protein